MLAGMRFLPHPFLNGYSHSSSAILGKSVPLEAMGAFQYQPFPFFRDGGQIAVPPSSCNSFSRKRIEVVCHRHAILDQRWNVAIVALGASQFVSDDERPPGTESV